MDAYTDYDDLFADAHAKPDFPIGIFLTDNQDLIEGSPEVKSEENSCPQKIRREMEKWCRGVQIKLSDSGKNTKAMEAFR